MQEIEDPYRTLQSLREAMDSPLRRVCSIRLLEPRDILLERDAEVDAVYLILSGHLFVEHTLQNGRVYAFAELVSGNFVGEMEAILGETNALYAVRAYTPCEVVRIPRSYFLRWLNRDAGFARHLLKAMTLACASDSKKFLRENGSEASTRLAAFLLDQLPADAAGEFVVRRSRQDIALQLGVNVRTVNRSVRTLEDSGFLAVRRGKIHITPENAALLRRDFLIGKGKLET